MHVILYINTFDWKSRYANAFKGIKHIFDCITIVYFLWIFSYPYKHSNICQDDNTSNTCNNSSNLIILVTVPLIDLSRNIDGYKKIKTRIFVMSFESQKKIYSQLTTKCTIPATSNQFAAPFGHGSLDKRSVDF